MRQWIISALEFDDSVNIFAVKLHLSPYLVVDRIIFVLIVVEDGTAVGVG
jgi:hypothetical protein